MLDVFTRDELKESMLRAGFEIDYEWHPGKGKAVFIVAKKGSRLVYWEIHSYSKKRSNITPQKSMLCWGLTPISNFPRYYW